MPRSSPRAESIFEDTFCWRVAHRHRGTRVAPVADRVLEPEGSILQPALELFGAPRGGEGRLAGDAAGAHELDEGSFEGDHALVLGELNLCDELVSLALADLGGDRIARAQNLDRGHAFAGLLRR